MKLVALLSAIGLAAAATCPAGTTPNCCNMINGSIASTCAQPGATYCQGPGYSLVAVCCKNYSNTPRGYVGTDCTKLS